MTKDPGSIVRKRIETNEWYIQLNGMEVGRKTKRVDEIKLGRREKLENITNDDSVFTDATLCPVRFEFGATV